MVRTLLLSLVLCAGSALADPHWEIQYRYRQIENTLTLNDFAFPSVKRGIACGFTTDRNEKNRPVVLVTSDGGTNWSEVAVREACVSMFFLNDSTGWMLSDKNLWKTTESGRTWTKQKNIPNGMLRVRFFDEQRGLLAGREKRAMQTGNGGETWTPLEVLKEVQGDPLFTTFGEIAFDGKRGLISGWNIPPGRGGPVWMSPEQVAKKKQVPHYSVVLSTTDEGEHWSKSEASIFGQITRVSLQSRYGVGLVEFRDEFEYPSEVTRIDQRYGSSQTIFRQKDRAITDVHLFASQDRAIIAGYETQGTVYRSPIPGKLRILETRDLKTWSEMPVDYRAVAHSALIAAPDDDHVWVATDTGMILKLVY